MRPLGIVAVLLGTLLVPLDSAVNIDFPPIAAHFGLAVPEIRWLVISYMLSTASLMLIAGRVADLLGYRRVFLAGCGISAVAFVLCGIAPSNGWLLGSRAIQGVGAGLIISVGPALITSLDAESRRARSLGLYTAVLGLGGAVGPLVGALLIARFGWSAVFWFRAPMSGLALLAALALPRVAAAGPRDRFDLIGAALLAIAIAAALLALNQVTDPRQFIVLLLATIVASIGFIRREQRFPQPLIDLRLFREPGFAAANLGNALISLAGFAVLLLVPFQLARVPGLSILRAGLLLAASPAGTMLAAPLAGRMAMRSSPRRLMLAGSAMVGGGLLAVARFAEQPAPMAAAALLQGIGQGLFQVAYLERVTGAIPLRDRGVAGALSMLTRTLGIVGGAALLSLAFRAAEAVAARHGAAASISFLVGFRAALGTAAAIAALVLIVGWFRFPGRARNT